MIFNWIGVFELLVGVGVRYLISFLTKDFGATDPVVKDLVLVIPAALVSIALDLFMRYKSRKDDGKWFEFVYPTRGGHLAFIPIFVISTVFAVIYIAKLFI